MLAKAKLIEVQGFATGDKPQGDTVAGGISIEVQFNPETLKVSLANNNKGGNEPGGGSGRQFIGSGTSSLTVEFVFDTTAEGTNGDVRKKTEQVAKFIMAKEQAADKDNRRMPPRCRFEWGAFIFEGVVDSMDETLDYFSEEGVPLRATVSLKLSRDDIAFLHGTDTRSAGLSPLKGSAGQRPLQTAGVGDSVQSLAARTGQSRDWKSIAAANNIDNPLRLAAGVVIDLHAAAGASVSAGAGVRAGASGSAGASAGVGIGFGAAAGAGAAAGFSAGIGGGAGFAAGVGLGAGISAGASAGASAGIGASAGASAGIGIGASGGAGAGGSAGAGFGAVAGIGLRAGAGVNAGAGARFGTSAGARAR